MINQIEFFNSMAESWDEFCNHDTDKIKDILGLLNIKNGSKILDIGTGTGVLLPYLVDLSGSSGEITAIDISSKMIEVAKRKYHYNNVNFICEDIMKANLHSEYFDYIICYSVFPHFDDQESLVKVVSKYLNEGGKLIICHSQSRDAINNLHKKVSEAVSDDNLPTIDVISDYYKAAGLDTSITIDSEEMYVVVATKSEYN
ncbi:MAG: class I SAM-dependent methyltransferase [Firmicutes bacterium]|nr:class I SAM-dependent methyltransferase [Bacillota bacterium]